MKLQPKRRRAQSQTSHARRNWALAVTLALLMLSGSLLGWRTQARTAPVAPPLFATLTVTNTDDSGSGSLRDAIATAMAGDTINFAVTGTITLQSELVINKNLTIQGPGANVLTVSGNNTSRVFNISSGVTVTMDALTIANGKITGSSSNYGGGIYNDNGTLNLTNCTLADNSASGIHNYGGGIYNTSGTLNLTGCTLTGNSASGSGSVSTRANGGGIYNINGQVTLTGCTLTNNRTNSASSYGGGIYHQGNVTLTMTDCTLTDNAAIGSSSSYGGGIYSDGGSGTANVMLANSMLSGNSASGGDSNYGGGIYNSRSVLTVSHGTFTGNSVSGNDRSYGGGIYNLKSVLTVSHGTFTSNTASGRSGYGGAIYNVSDSTLNLTGSTLSRNFITASGVNNTSNTGQGGGIFNQGTANLLNCTLSGNSITISGGDQSSNEGAGGGIFNVAGPINLTHVTLSNNSVAVTGGTGSNLRNEGGGIRILSGTVRARNTIIADNTATKGPDVFGAFTSQGSNLIGNNVNSSGFTDGMNGDKVGGGSNPVIIPQLAPLANNGGPTQTHALLDNSPARDAGDNCVVTNTCASPNPGFALPTDQRGTGFNRLVGNRVDIGAVEYNAAPTLNVEAVTIAQGSIRNNVLLGLAGDLEQSPETLSVSVTALTGFGVALGPLSVDSSGNVNANVSANCGATTSTFTLKVTDNGTLFEEKTLTVTVNPDAIRPDTNLTGLPGSISGVNVSFTFSGTDNCTVSGFQCKLDNGGWTSCSSPQSYSNLSSGQHTFQVQAVDARGNVDDTPASYTWQVFAATCGTVVNPATLPAATRGTPFVQTLSAQPTGSYVFSLLAGQLPPGVTLVNTLGIYSLRGIPTTSGNYTFTIKARKNNSTCEGARTYTVVVP